MENEDARELRCPFCHEGLTDDEHGVRECDRCETRLHQACAESHGRCTTLGCEGTLGASWTGFARRRSVRLAPPPPSEVALFALEVVEAPWTIFAVVGLAAAILGALVC